MNILQSLFLLPKEEYSYPNPEKIKPELSTGFEKVNIYLTPRDTFEKIKE